MIQKIKNQNILCKAFTLIELTIVLVIIGIMLMATVYLSGEQIQKVKDKTVKESILAEMQSRYSRNLGSSSYGREMYRTLDVNLTGGKNTIDFKYNAIDGGNGKEETFSDKFEIKRIAINYNYDDSLDSIKLTYYPYKIACQIGDSENNRSAVFLIRVNDSRDYCFEINQKNCRLVEMSNSKCNTVKCSGRGICDSN